MLTIYYVHIIISSQWYYSKYFFNINSLFFSRDCKIVFVIDDYDDDLWNKSFFMLFMNHI